MRRIVWVCGVMATAAAVAGISAGAGAAELASHRATYTAALDSASAGSAIAGIRGGMVMELAKTCDGWNIGQRLALDLAVGGGTVHQDTRYAGHESFDSLSFEFAGQDIAGSHKNQYRGSARLDAPGAGGSAKYTLPAPKTFDLPAGTLFPVGHTLALIAAAEAGRHQEVRVVFEGSDVGGPSQVSAFIGKKRSAPVNPEEGPLAARPGWPMRMGFYAVGGQTATPEYEVQVIQLDNGVARTVVLDLGEFSVRLELQAVEALPEPKC